MAENWHNGIRDNGVVLENHDLKSIKISWSQIGDITEETHSKVAITSAEDAQNFKYGVLLDDNEAGKFVKICNQIREGKRSSIREEILKNLR